MVTASVHIKRFTTQMLIKLFSYLRKDKFVFHKCMVIRRSKSMRVLSLDSLEGKDARFI